MRMASLLLCLLVTQPAPAQIIHTIAGGGASDGRPALEAELGGPYGAAVDAAGNLYIVEILENRVRKVDAATRTITTVVTGSLSAPRAIAIDPGGNIYIADTDNDRVRRVDAITGAVTTVASGLNTPAALALDAAGNLYIADSGHHQIRRVDTSTKVVTVVAGNGSMGFTGDGGPATAASLSYPRGVAVDAAGTLCIADTGNARIRRVDAATRVITTIGGNGTLGFSGDGGVATEASFAFPASIAVDASGNVYIADQDNARVRKIDGATKIVSTFAGTGVSGFTGDGGPASGATITYIATVAVDRSGNVLVADAGAGRIRKVDRTTNIITTEAGGSGEGAPAISAILFTPRGVAVDASGNVYIADTFHHRIRKVNAVTKAITTIAGTGTPGVSGDGGPATAARIFTPFGVRLDRLGNLYIADDDNYRIRKIDAATGIISTVAGNGSNDFSGDGGPATAAALSEPKAVAVDTAGNLYIADPFNARIRFVNAATGIITTFAGGGMLDDGARATDASLYQPSGVAVDAAGNVYIADTGNSRIRRVDAVTRIITTVAGGGVDFNDGVAATAARLVFPFGVAIDASGNLYVADTGTSRIRKVDAATKIITTVAGRISDGFSGDGGPATAAELNAPNTIALDAKGNLYIADTENGRIREVSVPIQRRRAARH